ncbi:hypothetical protein [Ruegeria marisrubri]|uniref:hypothetical protein n=1 Tax=Ruegeria marisrubri TaxID=1685379 RepID=UPI0012FDAEC2|nr:hypothetical protein [Ruegeria marisrubri]
MSQDAPSKARARIDPDTARQVAKGQLTDEARSQALGDVTLLAADGSAAAAGEGGSAPVETVPVNPAVECNWGCAGTRTA